MSSEVEGEFGVLKAKQIKYFKKEEFQEGRSKLKCCSQAEYGKNSGVAHGDCWLSWQKNGLQRVLRRKTHLELVQVPY